MPTVIVTGARWRAPLRQYMPTNRRHGSLTGAARQAGLDANPAINLHVATFTNIPGSDVGADVSVATIDAIAASHADDGIVIWLSHGQYRAQAPGIYQSSCYMSEDDHGNLGRKLRRASVIAAISAVPNVHTIYSVACYSGCNHFRAPHSPYARIIAEGVAVANGGAGMTVYAPTDALMGGGNHAAGLIIQLAQGLTPTMPYTHVIAAAPPVVAAPVVAAGVGLNG